MHGHMNVKKTIKTVSLSAGFVLMYIVYFNYNLQTHLTTWELLTAK